jgi:6-methylsalicylate decarboxylase
VKRRGFLKNLSVLSATSLLPSAAFPQNGPHRIDIHHHILPPAYMAAVAARRLGSSVQWTPEKSLEDMERNGIATSLLSLIQPGVWLGDAEQARRLAREANDYGARLAQDRPGRFGLFATLPLPDADGSLREIEYALDTLKAHGIGLMTSYGSKYLGDAAFAPVWQELDRRGAVVYTHPLAPDCCRNLVAGVPTGAIEYATDTTRTLASLLFSGTAARHSNIRWIFSHGGGTAPFLLSRLQREEQEMKERDKRLPQGLAHELAKFYYDTAQANHAGALSALAKIAPVSHVLFGTDYPFRPGAEVVQGLAAYRYKAADLRAIERGNALRLMPQLAKG